ncbi:hypothetical protein PFICI_08767 [Pestalotiopsis fici W106-1]|uniref:non-specific serine/threonine protein kinase n=1 Tax=Pestalotiopsis fici (strain W106-1 / CGMCC3.15140) TaxID=1229662 RepID=W3WYQ6_PESFW|nr:uncharacterized protein PFICI_08767 [Pestalotiopsis fici W106-1]ETS78914.1 hypothetical protein PFICI_08767 [Pestalotiopsis fici W106-1]
MASDVMNYSAIEEWRLKYEEVEGGRMHSSPDGRNIWRTVRTLGKGSFGTVCLEECTSGPQHKTLRAVKAIANHSLTGQAKQREVHAMITFSDKQIREYQEHFVQCSGWFKDDGHLYIAMEFVPHGNLQDYINTKQPIPEADAAVITAQVAQALQYMHQKSFVHRDLKPLNILVHNPAPEWHVKISDFGLAKNTDGSLLATQNVGSHGYVAPEVLRRSKSSYTAAVDVWSLGAIAYCLRTGSPPFPDVYKLVDYANGRRKFPHLSIDKSSGYFCVDFVINTMRVEAQKRLTIEQCIAHDWLSRSHDIVDESVFFCCVSMTRRANILSSSDTASEVNRDSVFDIDAKGTWGSTSTEATKMSSTYQFSSGEKTNLHDKMSSMTIRDPSVTVNANEPTADYIRGGFRPHKSDIFIALMGVTGAGKSTFISKCTDAEVEIGHGLESCTRDVRIYHCSRFTGVNVYLIDTPGFDDTNRSDKEVLQELATWLGSSYQEHITLKGIIYLHRITDVRMQGSARRNLMIFKRLCGPDALKNVILATTRWEQLNDEEVGRKREQELMQIDGHWGWMKQRGSQVLRHYDTSKSAMALLDIFVMSPSHPIPLQIQTEMVDNQRTLEQTGAGQELERAIAEERERSSKALEELKSEMREAQAARDKEAAEMIRQTQEELTDKIRRLEADREDLKMSLDTMYMARIDELERRIKNQERKDEERKDQERKDQELTFPEPPDPKSPPQRQFEIRVGEIFRIGRKIGGSSLDSAVYYGTNILSGAEVAIKLETDTTRLRKLHREAPVYKTLAGGVGVPHVHWSGTELDRTALVLDMLGPSLEDLLQFCNGKFSLKTTLLLTDQLLSRLEYIHSKSIIHRNISPEVCLMGIGNGEDQVHVIDYSLSKKYRDPATHVHIPYRENKKLYGDPRYASINAHLGVEKSRRDDLESLGYMLLYFLRGNLPWQGRSASTIQETKLSTPTEVLYRGFPKEFATYMNHVRSLPFHHHPDYSYLRKIFRDLFASEGFQYDYVFDWTVHKYAQANSN